MKLMQEFKQFAMRGNLIDMAVGVIIGGAFGKIVSSLVSDIIMPPIGLLIGGVNFADLQIIIKHAVTDTAGQIVSPAVSVNYGNFIQVIFDFMIVAIAIFSMIKIINKLKLKKEEEVNNTPSPADIQLLTEIRDLLKDKNSI